MDMDDLAKAINQSHAAPKAKDTQQAGAQPDLDALLGAAGGGGQPGGGQPDLGALLGALGGAQSQGGAPDLGGLLSALGGAQSQGGAPDLGSLLGALGGGGQPSGGQPDLGGLLGALLGAGASGPSGQGGDPLSGLLGGLLGGGSNSGTMGGGPLDALIRPLAEKIGIPPQIAAMVVMFLANALLGSKASNRSGAMDTNSAADLNQVLAVLDSGQADSTALRNNQLVQDLSQQTGLDEQTAARSIGAVVEMLGGQQGLESLLSQ